MSDRSTLALVAALALSAVSASAHADPTAWRRSYALEARGDSRGALAALDAMPSAERAGYVYTLRRAWLLYLAGRHDESVNAYRAASSSAPRAVEPRVGELLPLMAMRRWQETEQRAREVLRLDADNYLASRRLALALYQLGRFDDARAMYQQVSERYPGDLEMVTGSAWCDLRRGRRDQAATAFRTVLAVSPDDATATAGLTAAQAR